MKICFCDLETTGLSREKHEIIEIAGVIYDEEKEEIIDTFHEYIKPNANIPAKITELTGISNMMVAGARKSWDVLDDFYVWCKINQIDALCGHNIKSFDSKFLEAQCTRYNIKSFTYYPLIDTLKIARDLNKEGKITPESCKQPVLARYFDIDYQAHSAIEDVKCLIKIYLKMTKLM